MAERKMNDMISTSLSKIRELVDAQTIIGEPINTNSGTTIIPVSKVSIGYVTGGLDYSSKKSEDAKHAPQNFGGAGGTGVTVTPVGFLSITADGKVELITIANPGGDSVDKIASLVEKTPDILEKIKAVFQKKKSDEAEPESTDSENV